jgi:UPF0042 nucleotide-binding protein
VTDSSNLSTADLRRPVTGHFVLGTGGLRVFVTSFAYRHGIPRDADLIFDVPFLDNPDYVLELRQLTGRDLAQSGSPVLAEPGAPPTAS